jgi:hypothetical protein
MSAAPAPLTHDQPWLLLQYCADLLLQQTANIQRLENELEMTTERFWTEDQANALLALLKEHRLPLRPSHAQIRMHLENQPELGHRGTVEQISSHITKLIVRERKRIFKHLKENGTIEDDGTAQKKIYSVRQSNPQIKGCVALMRKVVQEMADEEKAKLVKQMQQVDEEGTKQELPLPPVAPRKVKGRNKAQDGVWTTYDTVAAAAQDLGLYPDNISKCCKEGGTCVKLHGYEFEYAEAVQTNDAILARFLEETRTCPKPPTDSAKSKSKVVVVEPIEV